MTEILPEHSARFTRAVGPQPDDVLEEMGAHAREKEFPYVGPEVGGWLQLLATMIDAERVFEFGSGFGYSAYWFARALPADGEVVLTEIDESRLDRAREFLERGGHRDVARFEPGDALETIEAYDGPFDVVLIDHQKSRYRAAFETIREKLSPSGVIVADNVMTAGVVDFEAMLAGVDAEGFPAEDCLPEDANEHTRGVYEYLRTVKTDDAFETAVLPVGEGIAVSHLTG